MKKEFAIAAFVAASYGIGALAASHRASLDDILATNSDYVRWTTLSQASNDIWFAKSLLSVRRIGDRSSTSPAEPNRAQLIINQAIEKIGDTHDIDDRLVEVSHSIPNIDQTRDDKEFTAQRDDLLQLSKELSLIGSLHRSRVPQAMVIQRDISFYTHYLGKIAALGTAAMSLLALGIGESFDLIAGKRRARFPHVI